MGHAATLLDRPPDARLTGGAGACQLAEVVSVADPDGLARVQVRLLAFDGVEGHDSPLWARVAVPFAGGDRGAFLLPDVGDEVLVSFVQGDPRLPVVVGGLWNGADGPPETLGGSGERVDRWTFTGKAGTRVAIVEQSSGTETVIITTPGGARAEITDDGGGKVELEAAGSRITIEGSGVTVETGANVDVMASKVAVTAGQVQVDAAMSRFSGIVQCDVLQTNSVISAAYTPGAGNIW